MVDRKEKRREKELWRFYIEIKSIPEKPKLSVGVMEKENSDIRFVVV